MPKLRNSLTLENTGLAKADAQGMTLQGSGGQVGDSAVCEATMLLRVCYIQVQLLHKKWSLSARPRLVSCEKDWSEQTVANCNLS